MTDSAPGIGGVHDVLYAGTITCGVDGLGSSVGFVDDVVMAPAAGWGSIAPTSNPDSLACIEADWQVGSGPPATLSVVLLDWPAAPDPTGDLSAYLYSIVVNGTEFVLDQSRPGDPDYTISYYSATAPYADGIQIQFWYVNITEPVDTDVVTFTIYKA
jgi:hypothetical protein